MTDLHARVVSLWRALVDHIWESYQVSQVVTGLRQQGTSKHDEGNPTHMLPVWASSHTTPKTQPPYQEDFLAVPILDTCGNIFDLFSLGSILLDPLWTFRDQKSHSGESQLTHRILLK